jgi:hypothetical protein
MLATSLHGEEAVMLDQARRPSVALVRHRSAPTVATPRPAPARWPRTHRLDEVLAARAPSPAAPEDDTTGEGDVLDGPTTDGGIPADSGEEMAARSEGGDVGDFPQKDDSDVAVAAPVAMTSGTSFVDAGRTGTIRWGDQPTAGSGLCPHAFTAGGMTGTVAWGPAGAKGNQNVGSIQGEVAAAFGGQAAAPPNPAQAWVQNATGTLQVTRSYTGVNAGNQGNGYYVTAAAAGRINQHEVGHVASTRGFHDADLKPLLDKILSYTQAQAGRGTGADQAAATAALRTTLGLPANWTTSKTSFATHDTAANRPGGTFDTGDVASGTYPTDIGAGNVGGTAFAHRIKTPGEAAPA